jgi:hypothetical protein
MTAPSYVHGLTRIYFSAPSISLSTAVKNPEIAEGAVDRPSDIMVFALANNNSEFYSSTTNLKRSKYGCPQPDVALRKIIF